MNEKYADKSKLVIHGGSHGGMLVRLSDQYETQIKVVQAGISKKLMIYTISAFILCISILILPLAKRDSTLEEQ